ncbi:hypothetical protein, partial [Paludibacter jiangxiensis]
MKTFTSLFLSIITIVALGFTQKANAQDCTVSVTGCPPTYLTTCADTYQNSVLGAMVNFTPPSFAVSCYSNYSFVMSFDLNESLSGTQCWDYTGVQRVGTGGGELRLFQSSGQTAPSFTSPAFYITGPTNCDITIFRDNGDLFSCNVYLVNSAGVKSPSPVASFNVDGTQTAGTLKDYLFTANPSTVGWQNGVYNFLFEFSNVNNVSNKNLVTLLQINAVLYGSGCSGDVNFSVTSTSAPGFYPVGSTPVTYTATYKNSSGVIVSSQQCTFNVVVNKTSINNVSTTPTTCNGNNGSITFTASSANTSENHLEYSLDGTTWYPISGGNVVTTTPQAGTTTTSWQVTMTIPNLHAQTYNLQVRDTQKGCTPASQSVNVLNTADTQAPTFTRPADITIYTDANCAYNASPSVTGDVTNESDNCSTGLNATYSDVINNGTCTGSKIITRTWHLVDNNNNAAADQVQTITILDNIIPVWTTTAGSLNRTVECNDADGLTAAQALAPVATDNCSSVTYTKTSGTFVSGTCGATGTYTNTWVAKDACLNTSAVFTQVITITDNTAPTWTTTAGSLDRSVECSEATALSDAQALAPEATDNCGSVTYTKTSGTFVSGTCGATGTYTNTWVAKDACLNTSAVFTQVITITDNTAPTWTTTAGSLDRTVECSDATALSNAQALAPTATDNCGSVTYTKTSGTFVPGSCGATGSYTNTWVAKDACLNTSAVFTQKITIIDTKAPAFVKFPADVTVECDAVPAVPTIGTEVTATDNCDANVTITYEGQTRSNGSCPDSYTLTRTWKAVDNCSNETTKAQVITVQDTKAPTFVNFPADVTVECDAVPAVATIGTEVTATDNCDANVTITYEGQTRTDGTCPDSYTLTRTWKAVDNCNNEATKAQVITVRDTKAPAFVNFPADVTVECDAVPAVAVIGTEVTATDNCDANVTITYEGQTRADGTCPDSYTLTRTWKAV